MQREMMPLRGPHSRPELSWDIEHSPDNLSRAISLAPVETTIADRRSRLRAVPISRTRIGHPAFQSRLLIRGSRPPGGSVR